MSGAKQGGKKENRHGHAYAPQFGGPFGGGKQRLHLAACTNFYSKPKRLICDPISRVVYRAPDGQTGQTNVSTIFKRLPWPGRPTVPREISNTQPLVPADVFWQMCFFELFSVLDVFLFWWHTTRQTIQRALDRGLEW